MKLITRLVIVASIILARAYAQDTFSIVAADSSTREVGSAGASCVDLFQAAISDATFIGDLLPDTGAINTQASYLPTNQNNARERMRAGDSPIQIVSWLTINDVNSNPDTRQYGIVGFSGSAISAEGYTGVNCMDYKNHKTGNINGIYYAIQGNILLGQLVIDSMESRFRNAQGDLGCRLMAALQGAKMVGADTRCDDNNSSSLFAYVKVAQPTDNYGNPSFSVSIKTHDGDQVEPIDTLQILFNAQHNCSTGILNPVQSNSGFKLYPNPSNGKFAVIKSGNKFFANEEINIQSLLGEKIIEVKLNSVKTEIDLTELTKGIYFYQIVNELAILQTGKIIIE